MICHGVQCSGGWVKHMDALRMLYESTNALRMLYECSTSAGMLYECFTNDLRMLYESRSVLRVLYEHIESSTRVYEWSTNEEVFYECSTSALRVGCIQNVHKGQPHCWSEGGVARPNGQDGLDPPPCGARRVRGPPWHRAPTGYPDSPSSRLAGVERKSAFRRKR